MATLGKNVAEFRHKLADSNFQNWLKAYLVISFVRDGSKYFVSKRISEWHAKLLREIARSNGKRDRCKECKTENVLFCPTRRVCVIDKTRKCQFHSSEEKKYKPCPKGICNRIKDKIKAFHTNEIPSWTNTRAEKWCENPWEIAKCFMPPNAYSAADTIDDTDLNGILSVLINHKEFRDIFGENDCEVVRELVNKVRHAPELLLTVEELNDTTDTLSNFLSSSVSLKNDEKANEALQKIEKLKSAQLTISSNEITSILQDVIATNTHVCQNVNRLLQKAVETLNKERTQDHEMLEAILEAIRSNPSSVQHTLMMDTSQPMTEAMYQTIKEKMKTDLLKFNMQQHSTIPLSPLFEENDTDLIDFYVFPKIMAIDVQTPTFRGRSTEKRTNITSLRDVFFKDHKRCKEMYVSSDAGLGKSVFCKRLAVTWGHAHQSVENNYFPEEDLQIMREFDFFFLILLRDTCKSECEIEEMIRNQIICHLDHSHHYTVDVVEEVLSRESCLIVLDGLDEWTHPQGTASCTSDCPDIPHRKSWENSSVLTTTRPWKFSELNLKSSQRDQIIHIEGLDSETANKLTTNTITKLHADEIEIAHAAEKFNSEIRDKSIQLFTAVPLVLTYLICLWHGGQSFGLSKCDIYSNLIGLLLYQAEKKNEEFESLGHSFNKKRKTDLPKSIEENEYCKKYYEFLLALGKLAFETYFAPSREHSFAFEKGIAKNILTVKHIKLSLKAGFLTQNKASGPALSRTSKMSFADQTFQEYFAALYMQSVHNCSSVISKVTAVCNSIDSILTMSNVCIFLSGLSPAKAGTLSKQLCHLAATSDITRGYRSDMGSWNYFIGYNKAMKEYQNMHVACVEEFNENFTDGQHAIHIVLEDYIIDADYTGKKYSTFLQSLVEMNKALIKSIKIRDIKTKERVHSVVNLLTGYNVNALEKVDLKCEIDNEVLDSLLARSESSLRCFILKGGRWENDQWKDSYISLSDNSFVKISNAQKLEVLYLRNIKITHLQMDRLASYVSQQRNMKHIGICFVKCSDHADSCPGVMLNLHRHKQLKMLELGDAPFSNVNVNTESLEVCYVGPFSIEGALPSLLNTISIAPKLKVLCSGFLKGADIGNLIERMPKLVSAQQVWLTEMDLGESKFELNPNVVSVESFLMIKVKMSCKTFESLIRSLQKAKQSVRVGLFECYVSPESKFEGAKECIRKSEKFTVLMDGRDDKGRSEFLFRTTGEAGE